MKRIEREILAALDEAGPKSHAVAIYEVIARGRINPIPYAEFRTLLDRLAREPDEAKRTVNEMTMRKRRVYWLTMEGRAVLQGEKLQ